jgi:hypothetical protein
LFEARFLVFIFMFALNTMRCVHLVAERFIAQQLLHGLVRVKNFLLNLLRWMVAVLVLNEWVRKDLLHGQAAGGVDAANLFK